MNNRQKPITYNPGMQDFVQNSVAYLLPTVIVICLLILHPDSTLYLICSLIFILLDFFCFFNMLHDPTCKATTAFERDGIRISFTKNEEDIFVPWSSVYVNICLENGLPSYRQLDNRRVLCLSNKDINGDFVEYKESVNWTHKMPSDADEQWAVFLVVATSFKCKREAKKICELKAAATKNDG